MPTRKAEAEWEGNLAAGSGKYPTVALEIPYTAIPSVAF
jgi:hypothetical protein